MTQFSVHNNTIKTQNKDSKGTENKFVLYCTNAFSSNKSRISFFKTKKYIRSSVQMYGIFIQHKYTTDSILDAGDKELARKDSSCFHGV